MKKDHRESKDIRELKINEVAELCGCTPQTVRHMIARGDLKCITLSPRHRLVPAWSLLEMWAKLGNSSEVMDDFKKSIDGFFMVNRGPR